MELNKNATGTHLITVILKDYAETETITFKCEEKINADDVSALMNQAADLAEKDGFVGWMQDIPEKYFSEVGLKVVPHIITEIDNMKIGETEQEKAGVYVATCRDCNSFEDGSCYKYGGLCDPNACDSDCVHGENIFRVEHKKTKPSSLLRLITIWSMMKLQRSLGMIQRMLKSPKQDHCIFNFIFYTLCGISTRRFSVFDIFSLP